MAKRFTDTDKWKKPFIRCMKAPYKLLWIYILDECDHAGIWHVDFDVAEIKIGEKLNLEFALNTWFDTVFRQPPAVSDIYLVTNAIAVSPVFRVGASELESTSVYSNISTELVINDYTFTDEYNLSIMVPVAVYNALGSTNDIRDSIIRNFADKYVNAGITYDIITY